MERGGFRNAFVQGGMMPVLDGRPSAACDPGTTQLGTVQGRNSECSSARQGQFGG
jgi:hypothetical protein